MRTADTQDLGVDPECGNENLHAKCHHSIKENSFCLKERDNQENKQTHLEGQDEKLQLKTNHNEIGTEAISKTSVQPDISRIPPGDNFVYRPLAERKGFTSFRILALHGRANFSEPRIDLINVPAGIHEFIKYDAVSYVWGTSRKTYRIRCGEGFFNPNSVDDGIEPTFKSPNSISTGLTVGESVYEILKDMQDDKAARLLWIDALCINQEDLEERAKQVMFMDKIYKYARRVIVWVNPTEPEDPTVSQLRAAIDEVSAMLPKVDKLLHERPAEKQWQRTGPMQLASYEPLWEDHNVFNDLKINEEHILALGALTHNPWFTRIWCIQELVMAQSAMIRYGGEYISWIAFSNACHVIAMFEIPIFTEIVAAPLELRRVQGSFERMNKVMEGLEGGGKLNSLKCWETSLLPILEFTCQRQSTDPRDKVYGVLGLCLGQRMLQENIPHLFPFPNVDYKKCVQDVYIEAFESCMWGGISRLEVLCNAGYVAVESPAWEYSKALTKGQHWPSWLPDWTYRTRRHPIGSFVKATASINIHHSVSIIPEHEHPGDIQRSPCLRVKALQLLTIKHLFSDSGWTEFSNEVDLLAPYPTSSLRYMDLYLKIFDPRKHEDCCIPEEHKISSIWDFLRQHEEASEAAQLAEAMKLSLTTEVESWERPYYGPEERPLEEQPLEILQLNKPVAYAQSPDDEGSQDEALELAELEEAIKLSLGYESEPSRVPDLKAEEQLINEEDEEEEEDDALAQAIKLSLSGEPNNESQADCMPLCDKRAFEQGESSQEKETFQPLKFRVTISQTCTGSESCACKRPHFGPVEQKTLSEIDRSAKGYTPAEIKAAVAYAPRESDRNPMLMNRKVFLSAEGFLGQVPSETQEGDQIAIIFGAPVPFVVREDGDHWILIGECYVLGLMEGEANDPYKSEDMYLW